MSVRLSSRTWSAAGAPGRLLLKAQSGSFGNTDLMALTSTGSIRQNAAASRKTRFYSLFIIGKLSSYSLLFQTNFSMLLKEVRQEFDKFGYILTVAVVAGEANIDSSYEVPELSK